MLEWESVATVWIYYKSMALNHGADNGFCLCQVSSLIRDFHVCGNYSVCWWQPVAPTVAA